MEISKECFRFKQVGTGAYNVLYRTPFNRGTWVARVNDMRIIDKVMNEHDPTIKDMRELRRIVKANGHQYPKFEIENYKLTY